MKINEHGTSVARHTDISDFPRFATCPSGVPPTSVEAMGDATSAARCNETQVLNTIYNQQFCHSFIHMSY